LSVKTTLSPEELEVRLRKMYQPWRWADLFGDERPVEVEIGTGNGAFIVDAALRSAERGFLGIEVSKRFFAKASRCAARKGASNVRMVCADAAYVLSTFVPRASVAAYHIYFPEPWPKDRHAKRRLFRPTLVSQLAETLKRGGYLFVVTDVEDYFGIIKDLLAREARLEGTGELEAPPASVRGRALTSYEKKYRAEGRPIRYASWRRRHEVAAEEEASRPAAPVEPPKEEPMPHVVIERPMTLRDYVAGFKSLVHKEGDILSKASEAYLSSSGSSALVKAVAVEDSQHQKFFVLMSEKSAQATIRLLRATDPDKTRGVKLLLALVAKDLLERSDGASYGTTNIEPYLF
jgi:tRNA (guanine-N7-)-methyltransferase